MHPDIVKKLNEIIGILKMAEREISGYSNYTEKKSAASRSAHEVEEKHNQLLLLIQKHGSDETVNKYYRQLTQEVSRILDIKEPPKSDFRFN